jgi:hypothetical protein
VHWAWKGSNPNTIQFNSNNTTIELKDISYIFDNTGTRLSQNMLHQMPILSDVFDIFFSSNAVLTPNWQFLHCATVVFCEQYIVDPGHNDISLNYTTSIMSNVLWNQLIPHC